MIDLMKRRPLSRLMRHADDDDGRPGQMMFMEDDLR